MCAAALSIFVLVLCQIQDRGTVVKSVRGMKLGKSADTGDRIMMKAHITSWKGQTEINVVKLSRNKTVRKDKNTMSPYYIIPFI